LYRDALRGVLDAQGRPLTPMRVTLVPEVAQAGTQPWSIDVRPQPDHSVQVIVTEHVEQPERPLIVGANG
jgi:hypothetical protein